MAKVTPKKGSLSVDFKPTPQSVLADVERQEAILSAMEGTGAFPEQTQPEIPEQDQPLPDLSGRGWS